MIITHDQIQSLIQFNDLESSKVKRMIKSVKDLTQISVIEKSFSNSSNDKKFLLIKIIGTTPTERSVLFSAARDSIKTFE